MHKEHERPFINVKRTWLQKKRCFQACEMIGFKTLKQKPNGADIGPVKYLISANCRTSGTIPEISPIGGVPFNMCPCFHTWLSSLEMRPIHITASDPLRKAVCKFFLDTTRNASVPHRLECSLQTDLDMCLRSESTALSGYSSKQNL